MAPFELKLYKPPGRIDLKHMPYREEPKSDFKREWKHWVQDTMWKTKDRLDQVQARYKKKYDARLRKQSGVLHEDDYV